MFRRNRSFTRFSVESPRLAPCKAVLVPADPALEAVQAFQQASQTVARELMIESTLHIPATQRFECFQKYAGALDVDTTVKVAPSAICTSSEASHTILTTNNPVGRNNSAIDIGPITEAAACYASPVEVPAEEEFPQISRAALRQMPSTRAAFCRTAHMASTLELETVYQRAAAVLELYTGQVMKAAHATRHRRRRALRQALVNAIRTSRQLLRRSMQNVPKAQQLRGDFVSPGLVLSTREP